MNVLLGHLNSNGDCLFATVIARQIKEVDYPGCHLTWAVNSKCRQSVELNPHIDEIWEIPTEKAVTSQAEWNTFIHQVEERKTKKDFDLVFLTQIIGDKWINYDGGVRSSIYGNYPNEISVPHQPVIRLSETEIENVARFAENHRLSDYRHVVLVECGPDSFEASLNPQSAYELAVKLTTDDKNTVVILSSNKKIDSAYENIIDGSAISFRENAELTKYCNLFIGCGSGISWLATSDWAKKLNSILVINDHNPILPSIAYDHEFLGLPTDHIIEIKDSGETIKKLEKCLLKAKRDGFSKARKVFNETVKLADYSELKKQLRAEFIQRDPKGIVLCLWRYFRRNGLQMFFTRQFKDVVQQTTVYVLGKILRLISFHKRLPKTDINK